jgi:5-hydroxyisourate hydrolase
MDKLLPDRRDFLSGAAAAAATLATDVAFAQTQSPPAAMTAAPGAQAGATQRLTMHAIDTFHGRPGAGMVTDLSIWEGESFRKLKTVVSSPNGRPAEPLLTGDAFVAGRYEMLMHFDDYYSSLGVKMPDLPFLTKVFVRFAIVDNKQAYHVPVLFTPWSYSYYRGS